MWEVVDDFFLVVGEISFFCDVILFEDVCVDVVYGEFLVVFDFVKVGFGGV